jgi:hypothetical protein
MKNIHLILTEKPSRLQINKYNKLFLSLEPREYSDCVNQNIHITFDEKPKQGEWSLYQNKIHKCIEDIIGDEFKKIILTTDQDLIKEGVQAIPDEFLDWFIENPSCEKVDFRLLAKLNKSTKKYEDFWEIFIPEEEPKFEDSIENSVNIMSIANSMFGKKEEPKPVWKQIIEDCGGKEAFMEAAGLKPKQETLEEFAKQEAIKQYSEDTFGNLIVRKSIEKGAKWQQEQDNKLYSEEDLINAFNEGQALNVRGKLIQGKEWFEQFKNK